jgi:ketosteroid isomerase-like protein
MSEENVELVRDFVERGSAEGLDFLMEPLDPEIEWVPVQSDPEYSAHRGHEDVRAWLTAWSESFRTCVGSSSALSMRGTCMWSRSCALRAVLRRPASMWKPSYAVVFTVRGKKITRIHEHLDVQEALEAVGLSE